MTEYIVHCPNRSCGLVFKPDPVIYKQGDRRCPRCGTDFTQPSPSIGRPEDYGKDYAKAPEAVDDWKRRVNFDFGKGGLKGPKGFRELTVDEEVTVLVTGKVTSIRVDTGFFQLLHEYGKHQAPD